MQKNQLLFLGTSAADWRQPGKDGRRRHSAAALLNGSLLLDCGPSILEYLETDPDVLRGVTDVLITHDHEDHLDLSALLHLCAGRHIRVACDAFARAIIGTHPMIDYVHVTPLVPFSTGGFRVVPVLANHDTAQSGVRQACHYIIRTPNGRTVFYGLDGAWFLRPSWQEMKRHRFDVMVLDCTVGDRDDWRIFEHNSIPMLRMLAHEIEAQKMLAHGGVIVASHFARKQHAPPDKTERILDAFRVRMAVDGMTIVF